MISLVRPFTLNSTEPVLFALNLYNALIYGLHIWFEPFPIVFLQIYRFNLGEEGLAFLGILFDGDGNIQPEKRIPPSFVGAFAIPICLRWFGWSARADVHWILPIVGSGFFSVGSMLLFNSVLNYLPDAYRRYAASVLAGNDLFRSAFGAGFPLFADAMYKKLGVNWASSTLGFVSIAFIPVPFAPYKWGPEIQRRSKMAKHDSH